MIQKRLLMKANISNRSILIIALILVAALLFVAPLEKLLGKEPILGAVVAKVFVKSQVSNQTCDISLVGGWNLVSIPCVPQNTSVDFILSSISGNYSSIHTYNTSEQLDYWKAYNPSMPSWVVQDINNISEDNGYWIKVASQDNIFVNGTITTPTSINLVS